MVFLEKILQIFKKTQHGYFASVSDLKVFLAYAISKRSNLEFFSEKWCFSLEKIFESSQENFAWHFLSRKRVRFSNCFGNLKTFKFLGFCEKWMLFLRRSKFSSKIGKRGIFLLAYVSNSIFAQENSDCSKKWGFREKRRVISKKSLNFLKSLFMAKTLKNVSQKEFLL